MHGRRVLATAVVIAVGVEGYAFRGEIADALTAIGSVDVGWLVTAVAAAMVSMAGFARTQRRMLRAGGADVSIVKMMGLVYTANAINWTFPGGTALSAGYAFTWLRTQGVRASAATFALAASGLLSSGTLVVLATTYAAASGASIASALAGSTGAAVLIVAAVIAWRRPRWIERALIRCSRIVRRNHAAESVERFVASLAAIRPARRDWTIGAAFAALNWIADYACLVACCRAVGGGHIDALLLGGTFVAGMTASSVSLVPGGVGVIDVAMVLTLTAGGVSAPVATACVVLYRLVSCALVVLAGWTIWAVGKIVARRYEAGSRAAIASATPATAS